MITYSVVQRIWCPISLDLAILLYVRMCSNGQINQSVMSISVYQHKNRQISISRHLSDLYRCGIVSITNLSKYLLHCALNRLVRPTSTIYKTVFKGQTYQPSSLCFLVMHTFNLAYLAYYVGQGRQQAHIIGASLSEPHINSNALRHRNIYVTGFEKTLRMGSARDSRNARF